jgi:hypothetical protein
VDIGCGQVLQLQGLREADLTLILKGFDDSSAVLARGRARQMSVAPLDIVGLSRREARAFADANGSFDLALCLEVARAPARLA